MHQIGEVDNTHSDRANDDERCGNAGCAETKNETEVDAFHERLVRITDTRPVISAVFHRAFQSLLILSS